MNDLAAVPVADETAAIAGQSQSTLQCARSATPHATSAAPAHRAASTRSFNIKRARSVSSTKVAAVAGTEWEVVGHEREETRIARATRVSKPNRL